MAKKDTSSYVLNLKLETELFQEHILEKRFEIGRKISNFVLGKEINRLSALKNLSSIGI